MKNAEKDHGPLATIARLVAATNAHDVEGIVACFAPDYSLEVPAHPLRSFRGSDQVRRNWTQMFAAIPDMTTRLLGSATDEEKIWTEWEMAGTRPDGGVHLMRGVFIFGVQGGSIRSGRMFLEPVDASGENMDRAILAQVGPRGPGTRR